MPDTPDARLVGFLYETGLMKRAKRSGWWLAGVKDPESLAEHSFRVAVIGYVLAVMEGADPNRTAALCVFHDSGETRLGDVPSVGRPYVTTAPEAKVVADQVAGVPTEVAAAICQLIDEYEEEDTAEATLAHDADKLECLLQAREYVAQGYADAESWAAGSAAAVRSASGRRLAEAALEVAPAEWWRTFVESYRARRRPDLKPILESR